MYRVHIDITEEIPEGSQTRYVDRYSQTLITDGTLGDAILTTAQALREDPQEIKEKIEEDLGIPIEWDEPEPGKYVISSYRHYDDLRDKKYREEMIQFQIDRLNRFVNVFRPRLEAISEDL